MRLRHSCVAANASGEELRVKTHPPTRASQLRRLALASLAIAAACSGRATAPPPPPLQGPVIAYSASSASGFAIWLAQTDGQAHRVIATDTSILMTPAWSSDGSWIAFARDIGVSNRIGIDVMRADGTGRVHIDNGRTRSWEPSWSPDGQEIAFASGSAGKDTLFVMNRDGTNVSVRAPSTGDDADPAWSPDGAFIAFTSLRDPPAGSPIFRRLFLMNADGSNVQRLTATDSLAAFSPAWSPDGRQIAFEGRPPSAGQSDIYLVTVATGDVRKLTSTADDDRHPTWAPDGMSIVFSRQTANGQHIYSVAVDGSDLRQVTSGSDDFDPAFRP